VIECTRCGGVNPDGARFCNGCGQPLAAAPEAVSEREIVEQMDTVLAELEGLDASSGRARQWRAPRPAIGSS